MKDTIYCSAVTLFALYVLGAFIAWDLNPANWDVFGRMLVVVLGVVLGVVASAASLDSPRSER